MVKSTAPTLIYDRSALERNFVTFLSKHRPQDGSASSASATLLGNFSFVPLGILLARGREERKDAVAYARALHDICSQESDGAVPHVPSRQGNLICEIAATRPSKTLSLEEIQTFVKVLQLATTLEALELSRGKSNCYPSVTQSIATLATSKPKDPTPSVFDDFVGVRGVLLACYQILRSDHPLTVVADIARQLSRCLTGNGSYEGVFADISSALRKEILSGFHSLELAQVLGGVISRARDSSDLLALIAQADGRYHNLRRECPVSAAGSAAEPLVKRALLVTATPYLDSGAWYDACKNALMGKPGWAEMLEDLLDGGFEKAALSEVFRETDQSGSTHCVQIALKAWKRRSDVLGALNGRKLIDAYLDLRNACSNAGIPQDQRQAQFFAAAASHFAAAEAMVVSERDYCREWLASKAKIFIKAANGVGSDELVRLFKEYLEFKLMAPSVSVRDVLACRAAGDFVFKDGEAFRRALWPARKRLADPKAVGCTLAMVAEALTPLFKAAGKAKGRSPSILRRVLEDIHSTQNMAHVSELLCPTQMRNEGLTLVKAAQLVAAFTDCPSFLVRALMDKRPYRTLAAFLPIVRKPRGAKYLKACHKLGIYGQAEDSAQLLNSGWSLTSSKSLEKVAVSVSIASMFSTLKAGNPDAPSAIFAALPDSLKDSVKIQSFLEKHMGEAFFLDKSLTLEGVVQVVAAIRDNTKNLSVLKLIK